MADMGDIVGFKGPISTPHFPKTGSNSSAPRRPITADVVQDNLGTVVFNRGLVWVRFQIKESGGYYSYSLINKIGNFLNSKHTIPRIISQQKISNN